MKQLIHKISLQKWADIVQDALGALALVTIIYAGLLLTGL